MIRPARKSLVIFGILGCFVVFSRASERLVGARFPAVSPDGTRIAFSYLGDLWVVSAQGGKAERLTNHVAYEREPVWSPDGRWLAFTSNRDGNNDVFVIPAGGGVPTQLTFHTGEDLATDFSPDGEWIFFRSGRSSSSSILKVARKGGNALPVLDTYWSWPHYARISPDGERMVFSLGMENNSWWRRGYQGSNSAKIWVRSLKGGEARMAWGGEHNAFWPDWDVSGERIYFVSGREYGHNNIWTVRADGSDLRPATRYQEHDVMWLSLAAASPVAVYERDFGIWLTDLSTGESRPVPVEAPAEPKDNRYFYVENDPVTEYRVSPDGKKIAAVVRGDIFILSSEGEYARNITKTPWRERDLDWDPKSRSLVYVSDTGARINLYMIDAVGGNKPRQITDNDEDEFQPKYSPDGKWISYYRGKRELRLYDPVNSRDLPLAEDDFNGRWAEEPVWSTDSRFLALVARHNTDMDLFVLDIQTKQKTLLTNTAYEEGGPVWAPDSKFIVFSSNRFGHSFPEFTGKYDLYRVFLEPRMPEFPEDDFEELFKEEKSEDPDKKKDKSPTEVALRMEDIDLQTQRLVNTLGSESEYVFSPSDPKTLYFVSNMDGRSHLWKTSLEEKKLGQYEPFLPQVRNPRDLQVDPHNQYLYYRSSGRIGRIELKGNRTKTISFSTKIRVDKVTDYEQMLGELYSTLQHYYYDDKLHNVDWTGLYRRFRPVLQQVREDQDFYDYANMMIGYLNSSHTGIRGPRQGRVEEPSAHVGAVWEFKGGEVRLQRLIKDGPLFTHRNKVAAGDSLTAVNGRPVSEAENIWLRFNGLLDKRLQLTFSREGREEPVTVSVKPVSGGAENRLLLEEWIDGRKAYVKERTGDRIAYLYMRAMGRGDLERFLLELERDAVPRQGLILDLRSNFGGNVHDRVLTALTKPVYAKWQVRGLTETKQSTFGFADKPVVLITNEVTLSDGEMTANGFKALKRGQIVGNTTYGWLIFTTSVRLMNGGSFRLPFWGCYTLDGQDLETGGGVTPDILVINDLNHDLKGEDPQLDKAIEVILKKIP
jgi:tricorn protease